MSASDDPYDLTRFVDAQRRNYADALAELMDGAKRSHWMWYVFPQLRGLGSSATAQRYGIGSRAEARAYLAHPILGPRLRECAAALLIHEDRTARDILGAPDDLKLRSCATLFANVAEPHSPFERVLERFFDGIPDRRTLDLLSAAD